MLKTGLIALASVLTIALSGCVSNGHSGFDAPPKRSEVVGTWVRKSDGAKVELESSGTITFTNVPEVLLTGDRVNEKEHKGKWTGLVTDAGTWTDPADYGSAYPEIRYRLPDYPTTQLFYDSYVHKKVVLTLFYGDDAQYEYNFVRE